MSWQKVDEIEEPNNADKVQILYNDWSVHTISDAAGVISQNGGHAIVQIRVQYAGNTYYFVPKDKR